MRNRHWSRVIYEIPWCFVIEHNRRAYAGEQLSDQSVKDSVTSWLKAEAARHRAPQFLINSIFNYSPSYITISTWPRSTNSHLRVAGTREFESFFVGTGEDPYQWVTMNFLANLARMPKGDRSILETSASAGWSGQFFASLPLDENMEMYNCTIRQPLTKVTKAYSNGLAPIVGSQNDACENVG